MKKVLLFARIVSLFNIFSYSCAEPLLIKHASLRTVSDRAVHENDQSVREAICCGKQQVCNNSCIAAGCLCIVMTSYYNTCSACVIPVSCCIAYRLADKRNKETSKEMKRD